ncbi:MAG: hypothetical protein AB1547_15510 [Thermodesulfobacteriota bacterium]
MLHYSKPFFPFWPSARSYELGLLSFSAAEQNSPAFLRVNPDGLTFCEAVSFDGLAKTRWSYKMESQKVASTPILSIAGPEHGGAYAF